MKFLGMAMKPINPAVFTAGENRGAKPSGDFRGVKGREPFAASGGFVAARS
ncbi:MAG: hypothetical protein LBU73_08795 [Helicobacteraceae bacterium]|jgi:hypothetical protein|nr:hypothetical protein [Helicobacteraceae bacterium]